MNLRPLCFSLFLGLSLALPLEARQDTPPALTSESVVEAIQDRCRAALEKRIDFERVPGVSLALILPDGSEVTVAIGVADLENEIDMTPEMHLLSGSIGKTYFSAAALHLAQNGALDLDAAVKSYFEGVEWYPRIPNAETITVRQLMRHQTGIPRYVFAQEFWDEVLGKPDKVWTPKERLRFVFDAEPLFEAGKGWEYADTNYILLGAIIEKLAKTSAYEYVSKHLLHPHGLTDTLPSNHRDVPGMAQGYVRMELNVGLPERVLKDGRFVFNPQFEWCGGGFANTPLDLARWARVLYSGKAFEGDYLSELTGDAETLGARVKYGLGVFITETDLGLLLGHDGFMPGYLSSMGFFTEPRIAAALQANADDGRAMGGPMPRLLQECVAIAMEELGR